MVHIVVSALGTLYLIPNVLGETCVEDVLPHRVFQITASLRHFLVEDAKSARRLIKQLAPNTDLRSLWMEELSEHTPSSSLPGLLQPLRDGHDVGIISEAGYPCIADPGEEIVAEAHKLGAKVTSLSGPSSILMALAASGLSGEDFHFVGYLPVESGPRKERLLSLEAETGRTGGSVIFMETPYRSDSLLKDVLETCANKTLLTVANDLTTTRESVRTMLIEQWRKNVPTLGKTPTIFLLAHPLSKKR